ncbi:MAG TPA: hypothetical protein VF899_00785 [Pyrinomonadaceae bacterium]
MSTNQSKTTDETVIRDLVENWARAVRSKNLNRILANHSLHHSILRAESGAVER